MPKAAHTVCVTAGQALEGTARSRLEMKEFIFDRLFLLSTRVSLADLGD
jgi:hypothetical protein